MLINMGGVTGSGGGAIAPALLGGSNEVITFDGTATAGYRFNVNGTLQKNVNTIYSSSGTNEWMSDLKDPSGDYWMRLSLSSGFTPTFTTGTIGVTWNKISGAGEALVEFYMQRTSIGSSPTTILVEIASDSGGSTVVASGLYYCLASYDGGI